MTFNVEQLKQRSAIEGRVKIAPKVLVTVNKTETKREIVRVTKRVIEEHRAVLMALKNR